MFPRIKFAQKQKSLFSVDKTSSESAHEARTSTQETGGFGQKNNTFREKWDWI